MSVVLACVLPQEHKLFRFLHNSWHETLPLHGSIILALDTELFIDGAKQSFFTSIISEARVFVSEGHA